MLCMSYGNGRGSWDTRVGGLLGIAEIQKKHALFFLDRKDGKAEAVGVTRARIIDAVNSKLV